ncbi:MAG: type II secretion system protein [Thermoguttaceae bacterium]
MSSSAKNTVGQANRGARRRGFTLVEILVVMVIIAMLAAMTLGALQLTRDNARRAGTKATIAKINSIIQRKYESYLTRRVPMPALPATMTRQAVLQARLNALYDLMRMEMPDSQSDITSGPVQFSGWGGIARPALSQAYLSKYSSHAPNTNFLPAKCLYLIVMSDPEAREQFTASEYGDYTGDGWPVFLDGWKNPIMWIRWAPGCSSNVAGGFSEIQSGIAQSSTSSTVADHDPFDPQGVNTNAYHLIPLIYSSGGSATDYGIQTSPANTSYSTQIDPYYASVSPKPGTLVGTGRMPIHNHHLD